jgi:hypothetical protein
LLADRHRRRRSLIGNRDDVLVARTVRAVAIETFQGNWV